jgi:hypothetical protein
LYNFETSKEWSFRTNLPAIRRLARSLKDNSDEAIFKFFRELAEGTRVETTRKNKVLILERSTNGSCIIIALLLCLLFSGTMSKVMADNEGASKVGWGSSSCSSTYPVRDSLAELKAVMEQKAIDSLKFDYSFDAFVGNRQSGLRLLGSSQSRSEENKIFLGDATGSAALSEQETPKTLPLDLRIPRSNTHKEQSEAYYKVLAKVRELMELKKKEPETEIKVVIGRDALPFFARAIAEVLGETETGRVIKVAIANAQYDAKKDLKNGIKLLIGAESIETNFSRSSDSTGSKEGVRNIQRNSFQIDIGPGEIRYGPLSIEVGKSASRVKFQTCLDKFFRPVADPSKCF